MGGAGGDYRYREEMARGSPAPVLAVEPGMRAAPDQAHDTATVGGAVGMKEGGGFKRGVLAERWLSAFSGRTIWLALIALTLTLGVLIAPASSLALSEGRVYEMVTPPFKGGYGANLIGASPNGESALFFSLGVFADLPLAGIGSYYIAHREANRGWATTPVQPPFPRSAVIQFSSTLEYVAGQIEAGHGAGESAEFVLHPLDIPDTAADWEAFPGEITLKPVEAEFTGNGEKTPSFLLAPVAGGNDDLCHFLIEGVNLLPEEPFLGKANTYDLYDLARGCRNEGPWLRLVGVRNRLGPHGEPEAITLQCHDTLGSTNNGTIRDEQTLKQHSTFNAVSGDGSEIFFTTDTEEGKLHEDECDHPQLFVRLGGARTLEVSRPVDPSLPFGGCGESGSPEEVPGEVPCAGAVSRRPSYFMGASEDGSRVFFTSAERLVTGDSDSTNQLYMARIGCPESEPGCEPAARRVLGLTDVSQSPLAGEAGEVQGVVSVANDGSRVYFVARGVLTTNPNDEGQVAVKGADNLYVYDAGTQQVSFIADLCSGAGVSGTSSNKRCPSSLSTGANGTNDNSLWEEVEGSNAAQSTGDGAFLVFSSYGQLIERGTQLDADNANDVYRYDAETGVLDRVSVGEGGYDANGNRNGFGSTVAGVGTLPDSASVENERELGTRAVSENGSRIVFSSSEPLSPGAINGLENVYIWHKEPGWSEGRVSLISTGSSLTNDIGPVITPDGENVFFTTSQGLVPADTENDVDVYDARVGGGFPLVPAERVQCASDGCQGALTNPAPLLVPGSAVQAPGGNFAASSPAKPVVKAKKKAKAKKAKKRPGSGRKHGARATRTAGDGRAR